MIGNGLGEIKPVVPSIGNVPVATVDPPLVTVHEIDKLPAGNVIGIDEIDNRTRTWNWFSDTCINQNPTPVNLGTSTSVVVDARVVDVVEDVDDVVVVEEVVVVELEVVDDVLGSDSSSAWAWGDNTHRAHSTERVIIAAAKDRVFEVKTPITASVYRRCTTGFLDPCKSPNSSRIPPNVTQRRQ